jgi:hypothetical protein
MYCEGTWNRKSITSEYPPGAADCAAIIQTLEERHGALSDPQLRSKMDLMNQMQGTVFDGYLTREMLWSLKARAAASNQ